MPEWLPDIVSVGGQWNKVLKRLYCIFDRDFRRTGCFYEGQPVWWDQRKLDGSPYEEGFWHLITKFDHRERARLLDPRRAERLPWCKPSIANCSEPEIKVWDYREARGAVRTYIWLVGWDYVVVLERRELRGGRRVAHLITAFHVGGKQTRMSLQKKYEQRVA